MADLIPQTFYLDWPVIRAVHARADREGVSASAIVADALRPGLAPEIEQALGVPPLASVIQNVVRDKGKERPGGTGTTVQFSDPEQGPAP